MPERSIRNGNRLVCSHHTESDWGDSMKSGDIAMLLLAVGTVIYTGGFLFSWVDCSKKWKIFWTLAVAVVLFAEWSAFLGPRWALK